MGMKKSDLTLGYHKPPFTSVDHLHLHLAMKPYNSDKHKYLHFGKWMLPSHKAIKYLEQYGSVNTAIYKEYKKNLEIKKKKYEEAKKLDLE